MKNLESDHLSKARYVYRESDPRFTQRERRAIQHFKSSFTPEWMPADSEFSDWHYMVFSKAKDDPRYHYDKPVVILCDNSCFSATDIFLGTFKGWPGITLMGQSSGGGSARSKSFELDNSRIRIYCASMASFQPDGRLYDTHGIHPDIFVETEPEDYIFGGQDTVLQQAIKLLAERE